MADSHPADLNVEIGALAPATTVARGGGWRRFFFDPDPEANARYARADIVLATAEQRLPRRTRAWSILAAALVSWLLVVLCVWLVWRPGGDPPEPQRPTSRASVVSQPQG